MIPSNGDVLPIANTAGTISTLTSIGKAGVDASSKQSYITNARRRRSLGSSCSSHSNSSQSLAAWFGACTAQAGLAMPSHGRTSTTPPPRRHTHSSESALRFLNLETIPVPPRYRVPLVPPSGARWWGWRCSMLSYPFHILLNFHFLVVPGTGEHET